MQHNKALAPQMQLGHKTPLEYFPYHLRQAECCVRRLV